MKILLLFIILVLILINIYTFENFNVQTGVPKTFGNVLPPYPVCLNDNNCFPGYYFRSWFNTKLC